MIDDGHKTVIMQAIDPDATTTTPPQIADLETTIDTSGEGTLDQTVTSDATTEISAEPGDAGDADDDEPAEPPPSDSNPNASGKAGKKRKRRR